VREPLPGSRFGPSIESPRKPSLGEVEVGGSLTYVSIPSFEGRCTAVRLFEASVDVGHVTLLLTVSECALFLTLGAFLYRLAEGTSVEGWRLDRISIPTSLLHVN
jgi:hypothetical protein